MEMELVEDAVADEPQLAGQLQGPFGQHLTGDAGRLPITLDLLDRARQSDSREPLVSVRARQLCPLGDALGDALDPERGGAGKDAGATAGNGEVGDVTEAAVKVRGTETRGRRPDLALTDNARREVEHAAPGQRARAVRPYLRDSDSSSLDVQAGNCGVLFR